MADLIHETHRTVTQTDWDRLRALTDEDIARAVAEDPDAAPIPTIEELKQFRPTPSRKGR